MRPCADDPRLRALAAEATSIGDRLAIGTRIEEELLHEALDARVDGDSIRPSYDQPDRTA